MTNNYGGTTQSLSLFSTVVSGIETLIFFTFYKASLRQDSYELRPIRPTIPQRYWAVLEEILSAL